jgi:acetyltransferase-like isoleucine patch superfamily enzyme
VKLATFVMRGIDRLHGDLRTLAAREVATLGPGTRLTKNGQIDNILGVRSAIKIGKKCLIAGQVQTFAHGGNVEMGDHVFLGNFSLIGSAVSVKIGNKVTIAHNVTILDTNSHSLDPDLRFSEISTFLNKRHPRDVVGIKSSPVAIGDNVWISYGATILRGVTIGEAAVVGAHAVVKDDVEPWTVVAGNPARVINRIDRRPQI